VRLQDCLFVPIHNQLHWSLVLVVFPGVLGDAERQPHILHLDSLKTGGHKIGECPTRAFWKLFVVPAWALLVPVSDGYKGPVKSLNRHFFTTSAGLSSASTGHTTASHPSFVPPTRPASPHVLPRVCVPFSRRAVADGPRARGPCRRHQNPAAEVAAPGVASEEIGGGRPRLRPKGIGHSHPTPLRRARPLLVSSP
jgi:hypothetical protein